MLIKIELYGDVQIIDVDDDETILQAAIRNGLDPPFNCQLGVCATCKARLISGKIMMEERDSLTDEDIENGLILTCQAHPLTDNVFINYDD